MNPVADEIHTLIAWRVFESMDITLAAGTAASLHRKSTLPSRVFAGNARLWRVGLQAFRTAS